MIDYYITLTETVHFY